VNCLLSFVVFAGGWIVCSTLRVFFILGLNSVNFIPGLSNLCPHQRAWVTPVNCLLSCVICNDGWIVCPTLRFLLVAELFAQLCEFFLFWASTLWILFPASIICVPIREHGSHLWIVCSAVWFVMMAELFAQLWDFFLMAELFAQLCEFFYSGLSSVNFIPWPQ
jgi:hypothetical protein